MRSVDESASYASLAAYKLVTFAVAMSLGTAIQLSESSVFFGSHCPRV